MCWARHVGDVCPCGAATAFRPRPHTQGFLLSLGSLMFLRSVRMDGPSHLPGSGPQFGHSHRRTKLDRPFGEYTDITKGSSFFALCHAIFLWFANTFSSKFLISFSFYPYVFPYAPSPFAFCLHCILLVPGLKLIKGSGRLPLILRSFGSGLWPSSSLKSLLCHHPE